MIHHIESRLISMDLPDDIVSSMIQLLCTLSLGEIDFTLLAQDILRGILESGEEGDEEDLMSNCLCIATHVLQNVDKVRHIL